MCIRDRFRADVFMVEIADSACAILGHGHRFSDVMEAVSYTHLDVYKRQVFVCKAVSEGVAFIFTPHSGEGGR